MGSVNKIVIITVVLGYLLYQIISFVYLYHFVDHFIMYKIDIF